MELQTGTAYLNFKGDKGEEFNLAFGPERLALAKPAHLRVELKDSSATVAVFKGEVEVDGSSGKVNVEKKHSATFDLAGTAPYALANNLEPDPYDDWDKQQDKYHQQYSANSSNSYSPYAYGASDLNYYGSFYNMPGYGMMWQPYLVGAGWDPFMNGAWTWYPGAGIYLGLRISLGLDAISLRFLDLPVRLRVVLAAGKFLGRMEHRSSNHESLRSISAYLKRLPLRDKPCWSTAGTDLCPRG